MAKMKFKLDTAALKQFMFEKGERVGLIACTVIMVLVVGYALYSGLSSRGTEKGEPWDVAINKAADRLKQNIAAVTLKEEDLTAKVPKAENFNWWPVPYTGQFLQLFPAPDKRNNKKLNPFVLQIMTGDEDKLWQLNYYACGTFMYNIDPANKKATVILGAGGDKGGAGGMKIGGAAQGGNLSNIAKNVRPTRMVVVSAIFPMRDQLEEYRNALRYASVEELLSHRDELPKPIGLDVQRSEALPGGKWTPYAPLFSVDKNGKPIAKSPVIKDMMRRMLVDEDEPQLAAQYIFPGLVTPMPKLANAEYAKLDLKGFDVKAQVAAADGEGPMRGGPMGFQPKGPAMPGKGPAMPGKKGAMVGEQMGGAAAAGAGANTILREESWSKLAPELKAKFDERFNVFDPLAQVTAAPDKKGKMAINAKGLGQDGGAGGVFGWDLILGNAAAGGGGFPGPMGGAANPMRGEVEMADVEGGAKAGPASLNVTLNDALVRFFDPTVEPGKTYCYIVRVRMANPNYTKRADVEFQALADKRELDWMPVPNPQGWVVSPAITIPGDYFFYATDQTPEVKIKGGADSNAAPNANPNTTPIQVHRWLGKVPDPRSGTDWLTADWAIAERLYTRRGEPIGRHEVLIEMGTWNMQQQMFEIGVSGRAARALPKAPQPNKAEPIATGIPVDLVTVPPALVVDFDGGRKTNFERRDRSKEFMEDFSAVELLVLMPDGRLVLRNSRIDSDTEMPAGAERHDRFVFWRDRIASLRQNRAAAGAGVEDGPMMPGGKGPDN